MKAFYTVILAATFSISLLAGNNPVERIFVSTDREVYIAGDVVLCSLFCVDLQGNPSNASAVSYLELVSSEGTATESKIGLLGGRGAGSFRIPVSTSTGVYRLVAYTSSNTNETGTPWIVGSRILTIFNTLSVAKVRDGVEIVDEDDYLSLKREPAVNCGKMQISSTVRVRKDSEYTLLLENKGVGADLSFSVYHEDDIIPARQETSMEGFLNTLSSFNPEFSGVRQVDYDGEIISAKINGIIKENNDKVVATLSSAGAPSNLYIGVTDNDKVRFFTNNIYGDREIVCEVSNVDLEKGSIDIESPFIGAGAGKLPQLQMNRIIQKDLSTRKAALRSSNTMRLDTLTSLLRHREDLLLETATCKHYHLDNFVRFPSVREVLVEIIPYVSLRREKGKQKLVMIATDATDYYKTSVDNLLVMMDGVVITDLDLLLDFDAMLIEDIDVYTQAIACGKVSFSGIVNFVTKKNYVTALSFPDKVKVVDFKGVSYPVAYYGGTPPEGVEDVRQLLYWDPVLRLASEENKRLVLHTPGYTGRFRAVADGLADDGTPIHCEFTFEVVY